MVLYFYWKMKSISKKSKPHILLVEEIYELKLLIKNLENRIKSQLIWDYNKSYFH